ncbi:MAG: hypothetical protein WBA76_11835 [Phormidesmis sp.]
MWQSPLHQRASGLSHHRLALSFIGGVSLFLLPQFPAPQPAIAQSTPAQSTPAQSTPAQSAPAQAAPVQAAPTARYAQGEEVNLAEIVTEWRGYYADVPVYLCTCQETTCDQTEQWPYREYDRYQLGVALGPTNGKVAEASGANCFDIADGSRPSKPRAFSAEQNSANSAQATAPPSSSPPAPSSAPLPTPSPTAPPAATSPTAPVNGSDIPVAKAINNGAALQLTWPSGTTNVIAVTGSNWNVNVLNAFDCASASLVEQKTMVAQRMIGEPAVNSMTGNVAVPVLLDSCIETDQSAVFVVDPSEGGGYSLYRTQLPGKQANQGARNLPNEFSTYAFSSIAGLRYWDGSLLVRQGSASGAEALMIFRAGRTPAGEYAGCGVTIAGEGDQVLCPRNGLP